MMTDLQRSRVALAALPRPNWPALDSSLGGLALRWNVADYGGPTAYSDRLYVLTCLVGMNPHSAGEIPLAFRRDARTLDALLRAAEHIALVCAVARTLEVPLPEIAALDARTFVDDPALPGA